MAAETALVLIQNCFLFHGSISIHNLICTSGFETSLGGLVHMLLDVFRNDQVYMDPVYLTISLEFSMVSRFFGSRYIISKLCKKIRHVFINAGVL